MNNQKPSFKEESALQLKGYTLIAGIDEVGRGALFGPVMSAAVILPGNIKGRWKYKVRESKLLSSGDREYLFPYICDNALAYGIGSSSNDEIDSMGIAKATRLAMVRAINQLNPQPDFLLIDWVRLKESYLPQKSIAHGDMLCFSIACASIIAKVMRDRLLTYLDTKYPGYNLASHKGYGTEEHLRCIREKGTCPLHRRSFSPLREMTGLDL
jgi:ribonuclease HII